MAIYLTHGIFSLQQSITIDNYPLSIVIDYEKEARRMRTNQRSEGPMECQICDHVSSLVILLHQRIVRWLICEAYSVLTPAL